MTTIHVSTAEELEEALANATGGETIVLAPGDYGDLKMGLHSPIPADYASEVTIVSADPDDMAVITGLDLREVSNVTFDSINFDYTYEGAPYNVARPFVSYDSQNLTIRNSVFDGDVTSGTGTSDDGYGNGFGLSIRGGTGTVIEDNEFHTWYKAITVSGEDILISGNDIHSIRSDGINVTEVTGIVIEDNHFHDFEAADGTGDHRDMIQFWTNGAESPSTDIVIRDNVFDIAEGDPTQSIFMRNDMVDQGLAGEEMFYQDVLIEGNVITNAHSHGITVGETDGLIIRDNTVVQRVGENDDIDPSEPVTVPKINVAGDSTNVVIEGNIAGGITDPQAGWVVEGNIVVQATNPFAENYAGDVFIDSTLVMGIPIVAPDGPAAAIGAGAPASQQGSSASFSVHDSAESPFVRVFDATVATGGEIEPGATYEWIFTDGTTATGPVVSRDFEDAGIYGVVLQVTHADGTVTHAGLTVSVESTRVVEMSGGGLDVVTAEQGGQASLQQAYTESLDLGAPGVAASVSAEELQRVYSAEQIELSMVLSADTEGAAGIVMHLYSGIRMSVRADGTLVVEVFAEGGEKAVLESDPGLFTVGEPVDIDVSYDTVAGTASLFVDGQMVATEPLKGEMGDSTQGLAFGDAWGKENFDGTLHGFSIDVVSAAQDPYEGELEPLEVTEGGTSQPEPIVIAEPADPTAPADPVEPEPIPVDPAEQEPIVVAPGTPEAEFLTLEEMLAHEDTKTSGGVEIVSVEGMSAVQFDSEDAGYLKLGGTDDVLDDGTLSATVTFDQEVDDGLDRLLWNHDVFGIGVSGDVVMARVATADDEFKVYKAEVEGLGDEGDHTISVSVDSELDRIQITVDGEVVLDETGGADIVLDDAEASSRGWVLSSTGGSRHFDGEISEVQLSSTTSFDDEDVPAIMDDASLLG